MPARKIFLLALPFLFVIIYAIFFKARRLSLAGLCTHSQLAHLQEMANPAERTELLWSVVQKEIQDPAELQLIQRLQHEGIDSREKLMREHLRRSGTIVESELCYPLKELLK